MLPPWLGTSPCPPGPCQEPPGRVEASPGYTSLNSQPRAAATPTCCGQWVKTRCGQPVAVSPRHRPPNSLLPRHRPTPGLALRQKLLSATSRGHHRKQVPEQVDLTSIKVQTRPKGPGTEACGLEATWTS